MGAILRVFLRLFRSEQYGPPDRYAAAIAAEQYIGRRASPNVTISRRRLRDLLRHAFDVGAVWQVAQQAAASAAARPTFPPRRIAVGIYRLRIVAAFIFALGVQWNNRRFIGRNCVDHWIVPGAPVAAPRAPNPFDVFDPPSAGPGMGARIEAFMCLGDGLMGAAFTVALVFSAAALVLWVAYRVVVWIWEGFRST